MTRELLDTDAPLRDDLFWHATVERLGLNDPPPAASAERPTAPRASPLRAGALAVPTAVAIAAAAVAAKTGAVALAAALPELLGERPLELYGALSHVLVLAVLIALVLAGAPPQEPAGTVARNAWRQFRRGWLVLWASWFVLYAWLAVYWAREGGATWRAWGSAAADVLNLVTSAVFFYLFLVLDKPSVKAVGEPERDGAFRTSLFWIACTCGAIALLSIGGRFGWLGLEQVGPALGSMTVAVSMAFFVGRLSDSHLKVRRSLLAPLYVYVAIQMLWHVVVVVGGASEAATSLVLGGALALKVYLFVLITRWMADGALQTYFDEVAYPRLPADLE